MDVSEEDVLGEDDDLTGVQKGIRIGEYAPDPHPRRVVYASFNKGGTLLRRVAAVDRKKRPIDITQGGYDTSVKANSQNRTKVSFFRDFRDSGPDAERELAFTKMQVTGRIRADGWCSRKHWRKHKDLGSELRGIRERLASDEYGYARVNADHNVTGVGLEQTTTIMTDLRSSIAKLNELYEATGQGNVDDSRKVDDFFEDAAKMADRIKRIIIVETSRPDAMQQRRAKMTTSSASAPPALTTTMTMTRVRLALGAGQRVRTSRRPRSAAPQELQDRTS